MVKRGKKDDKIELLELYPEEKQKREKLKLKKIKLNRKATLTLIGIFTVFILIGTISFITKTNIIATATQKILYGLGIYTTEVKNVEITSENYNEPGSWHIDKSAKWIGYGKAQVTFDVDSIVKTGDNYKDVILVLDISGSMDGEKLEKAKSDSKELISYLLEDSHNRVALVTFDSTSTIVSDFSNDKNLLLEKVSGLSVVGATNYNAALQNVDVVMEGYTKEETRDIVTLFLTDGYPCEDTPNQIGTYEVLKDKYPYMAINGIQYEMGTEITQEIKEITDAQWVADQSTLNNVLFEASISPIVYEEFSITDYINNDYFIVESANDIKVSIGEASLTEEDGTQKITWNLGENSYMTGGAAKMTINLTLKEEYRENAGYYPTNKKEIVISKLPEGNSKTINSTNTPVLKNLYQVIYDTNTPDGCTLEAIAPESHFVYSNVTKRADELTCDGYLFKGWDIDENDSKGIKKVNDDVFVMPGHDVTIRGTWTRQNVVKSMDGTVHEKTTLYKVLQAAAKDGTYAKEYTGAHQDSMDASESTQKIYHWYTSSQYDSEKGNIILDKNNVIFAGQCWQMIRTTDTGGVKMIYNGEAEDGKCLNTRGTHIGYAGDITIQNLSDNYWYGTDYTYDSTSKTFKVSGTTEQTIWNATTGPGLIGKYTCKLTDVDGSCATLYLVESYYGTSSAYVIPLNSSSHYSQFGELEFNANSDSPAYVGYMYNTAYKSRYKGINTIGKLEAQTEPVEFSEYSAVTNDSNYEYTFDEATKQWSSNNHEDSSTSTFLFSPATPGDYYLSYTIGSEANYDKVKVYIDNVSKGEDSGNETSAFNLGSLTTSSVVKVEYSKDSIGSTAPDQVKFSLAKKTSEIDNRWKYGRDVEYKDGKYTLVDAVPIDLNTNINDLNNHHYFCLDGSETCEKVNYIHYTTNSSVYYIELENNMNIEKAINEMLYVSDVNKLNSTMKSGVDAWYKKYLLDYDEYIEDTIFCNDRSIRDLGGWNPNDGKINTYLYFKEYNVTSDLSCANITDRFSVSNEQAKLTYKVGLMSSPEMNILNNYTTRKTGEYYWLASPVYFFYGGAGAGGRSVSSNGVLNGSDGYVYGSHGVRPAVSLKPGTEYSSGDGSIENPYVVDLGI